MTSPQCMTCKYYMGFYKCFAFPEKIPDEIISGDFDHRQPFKDDRDYQWEPRSEEAAQLMREFDDD